MYTSTPQHTPARNRDLARVHALARELELGEEAYRMTALSDEVRPPIMKVNAND